MLADRCLRLLCLATVALLVACGTLPAEVDRPHSTALPSSAESPLARIAADSRPDAVSTGFRLMPLGAYSLDARIQLARRAHDSIDAQYYLIDNDPSGRAFLRSLPHPR